MKICKHIIVLLIPLYFLLMCSRTSEQEHDHQHDETAQSEHAHENDTAVDGEVDTDMAEWESLIGLETARVARMDLERIITVPGKIIPNQDQIAIVSPFIEASINCALVNIGDRVKAGDELACLTSPEIGILRAEYDKAKAELDLRHQNFERQSKLYDENIISQKAFQQAELERNIAEVNFNYAKKKLLAIGITDEEIEEPPTGHSHAIGSTIHIHAPISGVITERTGNIGQKVNPSHRLFEIINLQNVWCEADIFEKDLTQLKIGQSIRVQVSAYQNDYFTGRIFYIGSTLDPDTKTIKILVELENRKEKLKPGMFATTHIIIGMKPNSLVIPKEAILEDEGLQVVFVKEPQGYHRHVVRTGIASHRHVEVVSGLSEGDIIVTKGNYQLKSKLKMSGVDPHAGHVH